MKQTEIDALCLKSYILYIDSMTTREFCQWQGIPEPYFTGNTKTSADLFLQIDAIKHRLFLEKAKKERNDGRLSPGTDSEYLKSTLVYKGNDHSKIIQAAIEAGFKEGLIYKEQEINRLTNALLIVRGWLNPDPISDVEAAISAIDNALKNKEDGREQ